MQTKREIALFEAFTVPAKRQRYAELLGTMKGRTKVLHSLDHFGDLDLRCCTKVPATEQKRSNLARLLRRLGAPDSCYVISSNEEIDGNEFELEDALDHVVGRGLRHLRLLHFGPTGLL
jgi:hypothetical protein